MGGGEEKEKKKVNDFYIGLKIGKDNFGSI